MKRRTVVCLTAVMILCVSLFTLNSWAKYETIPPEIFQQYDPEILSGERPKFAIVSNADIWDLRDNPDREGDLVLLKLDADKLSSTQITIIRNWIKRGARVYLDDSKTVMALVYLIFNIHRNKQYNSDFYINKNHPVNTDVSSLSRSFRGVTANPDSYQPYLYDLPKDSSIIVSADESHTKIIVGAFKYGKGYVYFNALTYPSGRDLERFQLNLKQWLIGRKVPGAASTEVFGTPSPTVAETEELKIYDLLILRNGDNLSGTILNESFTIQTTYATLSFPKNEIKRILFESEQADIQIMELLRGDILRGVIQDKVVNIDIPSAGKTPIEQDKIREINFAKKQTAA